MTDCWVNGVAAGMVPADDRGLLYGDGLFETLRCDPGAPRFLELHLQRLQLGCAALDLPAPDLETLRLELRRASAGEAGCLLRLTLTRGSSSTRGYAPPVPCRPRRILTRHPLPPGSGSDGIRACFSPVIVGTSPTLAGIKHLNRLENVMARARLAGTGCEEAILSTATGELVGGTMSNLFAVIDGCLVTPPLVQAGVRGVMREVVLREAAASGIGVEVRPLRRADLAGAAELFFTNVRIGLRPVIALERWGDGAPGPRLRALRQRIDALRD